MNKYLKEFLHRGLMFAGFGPIVAAIVFLIISHTLQDFSISGTDMFTAIVSTYLLAFVQAGASIFNTIEHWSPAKSMGIHFVTLCLAYSICYIINSWIAFNINIILIFIAIFTLTYIIIYLTVYLSVKALSKRMNRSLS